MSAENIGLQEAGSDSRKRGGFKTLIRSAVFIVIVGAVAVAGIQTYRQIQHEHLVSSVLDTKTFYPGIKVQGIRLDGKTMEQAKAAVQQAEPSLKGTCCIDIRYGGKSWVLTQDDLPYIFNTDSVLEEAYTYGRSGDREQRFQQVQALKTKPKEWQLQKKIDEQRLYSKLDDIASGVECEPVEPCVSSFNFNTKKFVFHDGKNGLDVDTKKLREDVTAVLDSGGNDTVELTVKALPFTMSLSSLKAHMKKLGTFCTVSKNSKAGTFNMSRALADVNGVIVKPGETFSFLDTVGACDQAHGYKQAGAILNGKLIQQYGGGICQASTTLYGAALRSNMQIVERYNHTIPSSYVTIGQDATVSYPSLDFKFKNPTNYPVYIVTQTKNRVLTATLYGYQPSDYDSVQVSSKITQTIPAPTQARYVEDPSLSKGTVKLSSKARTGYKASAQRKYYKNGKLVKTEKLFSSYYKPQPAYYSYGKGTDLSDSVSSGKSASSSSKPATSVQVSSNPVPSNTESSSAKPEDNPSEPVSEQPRINDDVTDDGKPAA